MINHTLQSLLCLQQMENQSQQQRNRPTGGLNLAALTGGLTAGLDPAKNGEQGGVHEYDWMGWHSDVDGMATFAKW